MSRNANQRTQTDKSFDIIVDSFHKVRQSPEGVQAFTDIQSKNKETKQCKCYKMKFLCISAEYNCMKCGTDYYAWYESTKKEGI